MVAHALPALVMPMPAIRTEFPFAVETHDPVFVTLADGTRIAATIWRPETDKPVPVVVEMIPYRRRDGTVFRDLDIHPYLAGHGIASSASTSAAPATAAASSPTSTCRASNSTPAR